MHRLYSMNNFSRRQKNAGDEAEISAGMDFSNIILQDYYTVDTLLGQGTNAKVYKAYEKPTKNGAVGKSSKTRSANVLAQLSPGSSVPLASNIQPLGKVVAVKMMKTHEEIEAENAGKASSIDEEKLFRHEINVMIRLKQRIGKNPNIVELFKVCTSVEEEIRRPCLVIEFLAGGELFDKIVAIQHYKERDAAVIFQKLMKAVKALHGAGIVHRDLKPENIIFGEGEQELKICDFGTAKFMDDNSEDIFSEYKVGSPGYYAPETIQRNYQPANDIWSMGCILFTVLSGFMPFDMDDPMLIIKLMACRYSFGEKIWETIDPRAKDLIKNMLVLHKDRITADQVLAHPWFDIIKEYQEGDGREKDLNAAQKRLSVIVADEDKRRKKDNFYNNVISARNRAMVMVSKGAVSVSNGLRRIASRNNIPNANSKKLEEVNLKHIQPKNRNDLLSDIRTRKSAVRGISVVDIEAERQRYLHEQEKKRKAATGSSRSDEGDDEEFEMTFADAHDANGMSIEKADNIINTLKRDQVKKQTKKGFMNRMVNNSSQVFRRNTSKKDVKKQAVAPRNRQALLTDIRTVKPTMNKVDTIEIHQNVVVIENTKAGNKSSRIQGGSKIHDEFRRPSLTSGPHPVERLKLSFPDSAAAQAPQPPMLLESDHVFEKLSSKTRQLSNVSLNNGSSKISNKKSIQPPMKTPKPHSAGPAYKGKPSKPTLKGAPSI